MDGCQWTIYKHSLINITLKRFNRVNRIDWIKWGQGKRYKVQGGYKLIDDSISDEVAFTNSLVQTIRNPVK